MMNGQMTLLDLTQSILASMESDEVNSINDTTESYNVALLLRDVFYDMATDLALDEEDRIISLVSSNNTLTPTLMYVPQNVTKIYWVQYNQAEPTDPNPTFPLFTEVNFIPFQDFLFMQQGLREDTTYGAGGDVGLQTITDKSGNTFNICYNTQNFPQFYTTIDNYTLIFDSFMQSQENAMQSSNSLAAVRIFPEFTLSDTFVPPLDSNQFAYYRNKAKIRAFAEFKQIEHTEAMKEAARQKQVVVRDRDRVDNRPAIYKLWARYGRRGWWDGDSVDYTGGNAVNYNGN